MINKVINPNGGEGFLLKEEALRLFLAELAELTQKHKIVIGGCGCCYSPYLYPLGMRATHSAIFADELKYDKAANRYTVTTAEEHARIEAEREGLV